MFARSAAQLPARNAHALFFEISRLLDFAGDTELSMEVLRAGVELVPSEWKLGMELVYLLVSTLILVHAKLKQGRLQEAIRLNTTCVQANKGAGRLWASLVQLVHQCVYGC